MYVGQFSPDDYALARQYGTFDVSVDVTGTPDSVSTLPAPIPGLTPSAPTIPDVAPAAAPFPWWLVVAAVLLLVISKDSR